MSFRVLSLSECISWCVFTYFLQTDIFIPRVGFMKSVLSLDPDFEKCVLRIAQAPRLQHTVTPSPSSFSKAFLIQGLVAQQASFGILVMEP